VARKRDARPQNRVAGTFVHETTPGTAPWGTPRRSDRASVEVDGDGRVTNAEWLGAGNGSKGGLFWTNMYQLRAKEGLNKSTDRTV
jgi:hypothetical protein